MAGVAVGPAAQGPGARVGDLLAAWLPGRRWFPAGGAGAADVRAEPWLAVTFDEAQGVPGTPGARGQDVVVLLVRLSGPGVPGGEVVAQVPLVLAGPHERGPGFIGVVRDDADGREAGDAGSLSVHDGAVHPAGWLAVLHATGAVPDDADDAALVAGGRVLAGEQSNTSVVLPGVPTPGGTGAMLKILRTVAPGPHPDVVVPQTLTRAGWDGLPRFLGALEVATPPDGTTALAILSELVPDARDGFELACAAAARGESFAHPAADLGRTVAELHTLLRQAMPPGPLLDPARFVAGLRTRAATAVGEAPSLAARAAQVAALHDDLERRLPALRLQPIHGDLHLGQCLDSPAGWRLLDFEGEPQRPMAERTAPDLPLRDVAGMVRSFDYAAVVGGAPEPGAWRDEAAHAFTAGYRDAVRQAAGGGGMDPPTADAALAALVLDKALYEVVYESRQRPDWVHIPLAAVDRALGAG